MIHETAIVDKKATLGKNVEIGPYSIVYANVKIGDNTKISSHAVIDSNTNIGKNCRIFQYASVGAVPQDLKFKGEETFLEIGDNTTIREFATLHRGTEQGGSFTKVGSGVLLMAYSHIAHDCVVGNNVILANSANLAGHVTIEDDAIIGGLVGVHQFVKIGKFAFIGGKSSVMRDIPPFLIAAGDQATLHGLNIVGLKRKGFTDEAVTEIKRVYRAIFRSDLPIKEGVEKAEKELKKTDEVASFIRFIKESKRGVAFQKK